MATASDGPQGGDSPFTAALLDHIDTPGLDVKEMVLPGRRGRQRQDQGRAAAADIGVVLRRLPSFRAARHRRATMLARLRDRNWRRMSAILGLCCGTVDVSSQAHGTSRCAVVCDRAPRDPHYSGTIDAMSNGLQADICQMIR